MADSSPLIINRRLIVWKALDGSRKVALSDGTVDGDCGCCDTEVCGSPCDSGEVFNGLHPNAPITCCIPQTLQVSISAVSPGPCSTGVSPGQTTNIGHVTPQGTLSFTACLSFPGISLDVNDNQIIAWGSNLVEVSGVSLRYVVNDSATDCSTPKAPANLNAYILKIERVAVSALLVGRPLDSNLGIVVHVAGVCGRAYRLDGTRYPAGDIPAATSILLFTSKPTWTGTGNNRRASHPIYTLCSEETMDIEGQGIDDYTFTTDTGPAWPPVWVGGTAKIKKCCEEKEDVPCPGVTPAPVKWYQAVRCDDNPDPTQIWAREEWLTFDGDTSEVYFAYYSGGPGSCVYFSKSTSDIRNVPPDPEPEYYKWLYSDIFTYPDCTFCGENVGTYLQARDCAGDALLPVVVLNDEDVLTDGTAYQLPGTCMYFMTEDSVDEIPDGAVLVDIGDYTSTGSCETCEGSTPCPTDNTGAATQHINFVLHGCNIGASPLADGTYALDAVGDGTWRYEEEDLTIEIGCSGRYWILTVNGPSGGASWHKFRVGDSPDTGASAWELVDAPCGPPNEPEAFSV